MLVQTVSTNEDYALAAPGFKLKARKRELEQNDVVLKKAVIGCELNRGRSCTEVGNRDATLHLLEELKS